MALVLKSDPSEKEDGTEIYIEVEEATGDYDAATNPGGFGTPNPARNTLALVIYGLHKHSDEDVEIDFYDHNPLTVASYTFAMARPLNGHTVYWISALPIFDDGGSYNDGDIVYDNENPGDPFIKERVAGNWVEILPKDLVGKTTIVQHVKNIFPIPQAAFFKDELNAAQLLALQPYIKNQCGKEEYVTANDRFNYVNALLSNATNDFCAGAYNEGQLKVEEVFKFKDTLPVDA